MNRIQLFKHSLNAPISQATTQAVAAFFSFALFGYLLLVRHVVQPDLAHHIQLSHDMMDGKLVVAHPVFFYLIQLLSFFRRQPGAELFAGFLIFALSQWAKISLSIRLARYLFGLDTSWFLFLVVVACQLAISWTALTDHYIMGNISPNYFHNGTLALAWPVMLLFLLESLRFADDGLRLRILRMVVLGVLLAAIKPSFLFCWIPVMPFYVLYRQGLTRTLLGILQVAVLLVAVVILQSTILKNPSVDFKVVFNPFFFFGSLANHVKVVLASLLFPLVVCAVYWKEVKNQPIALLLTGFVCQGLVLSFCFYDTIRGLISPNMTWQSSVAHYLMFVFSAGLVAKQLPAASYWKTSLLLAVLGLQCASGLVYLFYASQIRSFFI